jgi:hypothetical protein
MLQNCQSYERFLLDKGTEGEGDTCHKDDNDPSTYVLMFYMPFCYDGMLYTIHDGRSTGDHNASGKSPANIYDEGSNHIYDASNPFKYLLYTK